MNLQRWLKRRDLKKVEVSEKALENLLGIVERDLHDANLEALSLDRRFANAYGAALNLASYVVLMSGYRVTARNGHHGVRFALAMEFLGPDAKSFRSYFDGCRRKRNKIDYDTVGTVTREDVAKLIKMVNKFRELILMYWVTRHIEAIEHENDDRMKRAG